MSQIRREFLEIFEGHTELLFDYDCFKLGITYLLNVDSLSKLYSKTYIYVKLQLCTNYKHISMFILDLEPAHLSI